MIEAGAHIPAHFRNHSATDVTDRDPDKRDAAKTAAITEKRGEAICIWNMVAPGPEGAAFHPQTSFAPHR